MASNSGSSKLKLFGAAILLIGGVGFMYSQYQSNTAAAIPAPPRGERQQFRSATAPSPSTSPAPGFAGREGMPSPAERAKIREEIEKEMNLTPEQKAQMDAINKKYEGKEGDFRARFGEMEKILTPEQREKGRAAMMSRFKARMEERTKALPPAEREAFLRKMEERMKNGPPGGFGRGGPGGPGGPPPGEGGPW